MKSETTYTIEVTQGPTGAIIDRFEITLDDSLDSKEQTKIINEEMKRRLKQAQGTIQPDSNSNVDE